MPGRNATPNVAQSFAPHVARGARVLVLGSMPGVVSLTASQYYAHPRNGFWPIMGALVGASPALPYPVRLQRLHDAGIALWDVFARCEREGSLDSAIRDATAEANDIAGLLSRHSTISTVLFNGAKAESAFRKFAHAPDGGWQVALRRLPSTSPANAGTPIETKKAAWREALQAAGVRLLP